MKYPKEFFNFFRHLFESRRLILSLTFHNFKKQYLGSYLGIAWAFIQPLTFILVIWAIFEIGFKTVDLKDGTPFFLYLACGIIPWFFFSNALNSATNALIANSFLVKKIAFRTSILPLVQIGSELIVHLFLLLFIFCALLIYGRTPSLAWLQIIYYLFCMVFLLMGISWLTSSIRVFIKDIGNAIGVVLQLGFWATPIFWNMYSIPEKYLAFLNINPMFYIISGIRESLLHTNWFWEKPTETLIFFTITSTIFLLGAAVFRKLKPHFGDVL